MDSKTCTKCGIERPLTAFTTDRRTPDGRKRLLAEYLSKNPTRSIRAANRLGL